MQRLLVKIHPKDTVGIALEALEPPLIVNELVVKEKIPKGHKIALKSINQGDLIYKYGYCIGQATENISQGSWVHEHNLTTTLKQESSYRYNPDTLSHLSNKEPVPTFQGYRRANGKVGTRNELWILPTVGCVNQTVSQLALLGKKLHQDTYAFTHPYGCSQLGGDLLHTQKILAAIASHPNAGGCLIVGLGCENNQMQQLINLIDENCLPRVRYFNAQEANDEIEEGLHYIDELAQIMKDDFRESCFISELTVGIKCGGSDAYSGITANPLVGLMTDRMVSMGGSVVMTEVPEMFGAEQQLMNRAVNSEVFEQIVTMVNEFKQYFVDNKQPVYENPSPGNRQGGITTLEEKSLGAIQKGGQAPVVDTIAYGDLVRHRGLSLLVSPGNDAVSSTALAASGAQVILFTTGRGTPLGFPVPTIKISTNSELYQRKKHWMDFDAGVMLNKAYPDEILDSLFDLIINVASGLQQMCNEINDCREIAIWKQGVTL